MRQLASLLKRIVRTCRIRLMSLDGDIKKIQTAIATSSRTRQAFCCRSQSVIKNHTDFAYSPVLQNGTYIERVRMWTTADDVADCKPGRVYVVLAQADITTNEEFAAAEALARNGGPGTNYVALQSLGPAFDITIMKPINGANQRIAVAMTHIDNRSGTIDVCVEYTSQ
jgi:hypothetical protein